jgi:hypothetical protein
LISKRTKSFLLLYESYYTTLLHTNQALFWRCCLSFLLLFKALSLIWKGFHVCKNDISDNTATNLVIPTIIYLDATKESRVTPRTSSLRANRATLQIKAYMKSLTHLTSLSLFSLCLQKQPYALGPFRSHLLSSMPQPLTRTHPASTFPTSP